MGGVGKTQLALKYSHEYRERYAGVWWLRAGIDNTLQLDARDACDQVGAAVAEGELPTLAFKRWLDRQDATWLLVFDNAESAQTLHRHLPQGSHHVLITSRDPAWGGVARPIELAVWSEDHGADFLAERLPARQRTDLQRLTHTLGGLQLALEQAAAFLEHTAGAIAWYCEQAERVDTSALVLDEARASTGYERSVLGTLSLAFPRLGEAARQLLRLCAFFSAEPIPERYFLENPDQLPDALADAAREPLGWERTVGELRRFSIAERVDIASLGCPPSQQDERTETALVVHRLTIEVARHALSAPADDGLQAQWLLRAHCPGEADDPKQWPRFAVLLPHLMGFQRLRSQTWFDRRRGLRQPARGAAEAEVQGHPRRRPAPAHGLRLPRARRSAGRRLGRSHHRLRTQDQPRPDRRRPQAPGWLGRALVARLGLTGADRALALQRARRDRALKRPLVAPPGPRTRGVHRAPRGPASQVLDGAPSPCSQFAPETVTLSPENSRRLVASHCCT